MDKLVSLAKRRGFIFQSSEIYGGINSCYDYGPLGIEMKKNIKDLFLVAPKDKVEERFNEIAAYIVKFYGFKGKQVRVVRTGRTYFVEVNILVDPSWEFKSVKDLDMIRNQFYDQVTKNELEPWVTFSFTSEEKWL